MKTDRSIPELIGPRVLAGVLGVSRSQVYAWDKEELIPAPVTIGTTRMWRRAELVAWVDAGTPPRWKWEWRPGLVVKIADLHALRLQQLAGLQDEVADLEARLGRGEKQMRVTAR